ncbi:MAG: hypothetical protein R3B91_11185 [Planctomycetaceae bacterium]
MDRGTVSSVLCGDGRKVIAPGIYFRMLFVGYFEGIDLQARHRVAV